MKNNNSSTTQIKHPAVYTTAFIPAFAQILSGRPNVLDPFGGTGKLALIKEHGFTGKVICNEIEPEWPKQSTHPVDQWHIGDAQDMSWLGDGEISAVCTSPTYGNRMADSHTAKDKSKRITYTHYLGRKLNDNNSGKMQWGDNYRTLHENVYKECYRVLESNGIMIVNISNHIRNGVEVDVTGWHIEAMKLAGFVLEDHRLIETPRMRFGRNGAARVQHESVLVFKKP